MFKPFRWRMNLVMVRSRKVAKTLNWEFGSVILLKPQGAEEQRRKEVLGRFDRGGFESGQPKQGKAIPWLP